MKKEPGKFAASTTVDTVRTAQEMRALYGPESVSVTLSPENAEKIAKALAPKRELCETEAECAVCGKREVV